MTWQQENKPSATLCALGARLRSVLPGVCYSAGRVIVSGPDDAPERSRIVLVAPDERTAQATCDALNMCFEMINELTRKLP